MQPRLEQNKNQEQRYVAPPAHLQPRGQRAHGGHRHRRQPALPLAVQPRGGGQRHPACRRNRDSLTVLCLSYGWFGAPGHASARKSGARVCARASSSGTSQSAELSRGVWHNSSPSCRPSALSLSQHATTATAVLALLRALALLHALALFCAPRRRPRTPQCSAPSRLVPLPQGRLAPPRALGAICLPFLIATTLHCYFMKFDICKRGPTHASASGQVGAATYSYCTHLSSKI